MFVLGSAKISGGNENTDPLLTLGSTSNKTNNTGLIIKHSTEDSNGNTTNYENTFIGLDKSDDKFY